MSSAASADSNHGSATVIGHLARTPSTSTRRCWTTRASSTGAGVGAHHALDVGQVDKMTNTQGRSVRLHRLCLRCSLKEWCRPALGCGRSGYPSRTSEIRRVTMSGPEIMTARVTQLTNRTFCSVLSEDLSSTVRTVLPAHHVALLQIHVDRAEHIATTWCLIVVHINAFPAGKLKHNLKNYGRFQSGQYRTRRKSLVTRQARGHHASPRMLHREL